MTKTCMLIPGNPAIASYYHAWIKEIEKRNKSVNITYSTSYVLFGRKLNYEQYSAAMLNHHEKLFLEISASKKVTLLAHSVGSYFALRLLEKYPEKIEKVIIIFPYIGYDTIPWLRFISLPYYIDRFFSLTEIVSKLKGIFLRHEEGIHDISSRELNMCLRFGIRQCVYFNKHVFDTGPLHKYKDRIDLIYKDNDKWCPSEAVESLKPVSNSKKTDLRHDFILYPEDRARMIEEIGF